MKLYDVPRDTKIKIIDKGNISTPISSKPIKQGDILTFSHIDGMYSYCMDKNDNVVHIGASTEIEIVK